MADLEEHAFKRDKRFVVRLVLVLLAGVLFGGFVYTKLTSASVGGCAARSFGTVTEAPGAAPE